MLPEGRRALLRRVRVRAIRYRGDQPPVSPRLGAPPQALHDSRGKYGLQELEALLPLRGPVRASPLVFSPDGKVAVRGGAHGVVSAWDRATGQTLFDVRYAGRSVDLTFSGDGRLLAVAGPGSVIRLINTGSWKQAGEMPCQGIDKVRAIDFSPDARHLAVAAGNNVVWIFDVEKRAHAVTLFGLGSEGFVTVLGDGTIVLPTTSEPFVSFTNGKHLIPLAEAVGRISHPQRIQIVK